MSISFNPTEQTGDYRGVFGWDAFTQPMLDIIRPAFEVELFLKEHSLPQKKIKVTELSTVSLIDPFSHKETSTRTMFEGAPDPLSVTLSGSIHSKIVGGVFTPYDKDGSVWSDFEGYTNAEIVSLYLEGYMNLTAGEAPQRKDPDYYITPNGHKYLNPVITVWEVQAVAGYPSKHNFSATVLLEK